jgi:hypothetical protein
VEQQSWMPSGYKRFLKSSLVGSSFATAPGWKKKVSLRFFNVYEFGEEFKTSTMMKIDDDIVFFPLGGAISKAVECARMHPEACVLDERTRVKQPCCGSLFAARWSHSLDERIKFHKIA